MLIVASLLSLTGMAEGAEEGSGTSTRRATSTGRPSPPTTTGWSGRGISLADARPGPPTPARSWR